MINNNKATKSHEEGVEAVKNLALKLSLPHPPESKYKYVCTPMKRVDNLLMGSNGALIVRC